MKKKRGALLPILLAITIFLTSCHFEYTDNAGTDADGEESLTGSVLPTEELTDSSDDHPSLPEETVADEVEGTEGPVTQAPESKPTAETKKNENNEYAVPGKPTPTATPVILSSLPAYSGNPYIEINDNIPSFTRADYTILSYEYYSKLDSAGRCGYAMASVGIDLMPTVERGSIGSVKPSGWQTSKYDTVDGKYLFNRCHLIGYQLSGENANRNNLITGTRYLNVEGMLPFENMVADYVKETHYHVLYRVTPVFDGQNLVASGVQMEGLSVEDDGDGICFNVFCYNVQPGITIDYSTGENHETPKTPKPASQTDEKSSYVLNTNSRKFHKPSCSSVKTIADDNREDFSGSREQLISDGYVPCKRCNP